VLLMLVPWFILSCWKWTSRHHGYEKQGKLGPTLFEYRELDAATGGFSDESKLGEGFFAEVYRGYINKLESEVAVKMIKNNSNGVMESNKDFYCELNTITSVRHRNLVKLVGWCRGNSFNFVEFMCWCWKKEDKLFLVYELMPNRSLFDHLHKTETLPWETRYVCSLDTLISHVNLTLLAYQPVLPHGLIRINIRIRFIAKNYNYLSHSLFHLLNILTHNKNAYLEDLVVRVV